MKLKQIPKEELELMGYDDIALLILQESGKKMKLRDIFVKVCEVLELPSETVDNQLMDFFELMSINKKFIMLDNGYWDLQAKHKLDVVFEDDDDDVIESDEDLEEDEDEIFYDKEDETENVLLSNDIKLVKDECSVYKNNIKLELSTKEYLILQLLMENKGKVFTKRQIYDAVWKEDFLFDENTVMVHLSNIRSKLEQGTSTRKYITTVRGIGYKWNKDEEQK